MNYKTAEIVLTIQLEGRLATRGEYEAKKVIAIERNDSGAIEKNEVIRIQTVKLPCFHECSTSVKLNNNFVRHAISDDGRPKRTISAGMWNKMSPSVKVNLHIAKFADDMYPGCEYSYVIIEGDDED